MTDGIVGSGYHQWVLANILHRIYLAEQDVPIDYDLRNALVIKAVYHAQMSKVALAGFRIDPRDADWPVAFIVLPQGQVSWHIPAFSVPWDGHSTEEKYKRVEAFYQQTRHA